MRQMIYESQQITVEFLQIWGGGVYFFRGWDSSNEFYAGSLRFNLVFAEEKNMHKEKNEVFCFG